MQRRLRSRLPDDPPSSVVQTATVKSGKYLFRPPKGDMGQPASAVSPPRIPDNPVPPPKTTVRMPWVEKRRTVSSNRSNTAPSSPQAPGPSNTR